MDLTDRFGNSKVWETGSSRRRHTLQAVALNRPLYEPDRHCRQRFDAVFSNSPVAATNPNSSKYLTHRSSQRNRTSQEAIERARNCQ
jgi:hypothetical protein